MNTETTLWLVERLFMSPKILNSFGLALDIAGAILVFKYGVIELVEKDEKGNLSIRTAYSKELKRFRKLAITGIFLLVIGFIFQIISNWLPNLR